MLEKRSMKLFCFADEKQGKRETRRDKDAEMSGAHKANEDFLRKAFCY